MQFSQSEIRDITRYLEEGKPLPEKYRFYLFEDKKEVELVWNGKTNEVTNVVLPFQVIEQVDEPRKEWWHKVMQSLFDFDDRWRQIKGWTNKLIRWDNKLILSSLKNWPLRAEIEKQWGIKLIYIDPPFDVWADFSMKVEIWEEEFTKNPTVLEELAYRDTWGKWADSFISMMYERLKLMRDLLADDGSIYIHCDYRVSGFLRLIIDELFWKENFRNEIIWWYRTGGISKEFFARKHDVIFYYSKNLNSVKFNTQFYKSYQQKKYNFKGVEDLWDEEKKQRYHNSVCRDVWEDIYPIGTENSERLDYPTQKPIALLERIIKASSNEWDIVCDFFMWSWTTLAVAEKLWRKWIWSDLWKFSIHTSRKRMINIQRDLKQNGQDYRAFEILNLWKYERSFYLTEPDIIPENMQIESWTENIETRIKQTKQKILDKKQEDFINLIIQAYKWEKVGTFNTLHGKKAWRVFAIWPIDFAVGRDFIDRVLAECKNKELNKVDILGFEFEMSIWPHIIEDAKKQGIDLAIKYIPRDVFDKRAVEKWQVKFFDIAYIEVKPEIKEKSISIELTDFSVYYTQEDLDTVIENMKNWSNRVIMDWGQIYKVIKDKDWITTKELLTEKWTDWIDYWSVDFDFESKKEIVRHKNESWEEIEEWTGNYVFENEWQSFRTKKDKTLELKTPAREYMWKWRKKIAIKVIDIFGNDNMKIIEVNI